MKETNTLKDKISQQYQTIQRLPPWLIPVAGIAGVILLFIIIFGFMRSDDDDNSENLLADKLSVGSKDLKLKQATVSVKKGMMHDIEKATKTDNVKENNSKIDAIKLITEQNKEQIASIEKMVEQLQSQLNQIPEEYQQHGVEIQNIHSQLVSLKTTQQKLQKALPKKITPVKRKRRYRPRPTFKLVSIDIWGSDASIIVRHESQLHDLTQGQSLGKWQVDSIDINGSKVIFRNQYGVRHTLFIES